MSNVSGDFLKYGASFIITKNDYNMYYRDPASMLGKGGKCFVTPTNQMDKLLILADGNTTVIEVGLGKDIGDWSGQELVRIDVDKSIVTKLYNDGRLTEPEFSQVMNC